MAKKKGKTSGKCSIAQKRDRSPHFPVIGRKEKELYFLVLHMHLLCLQYKKLLNRRTIKLGQHLLQIQIKKQNKRECLQILFFTVQYKTYLPAVQSKRASEQSPVRANKEFVLWQGMDVVMENQLGHQNVQLGHWNVQMTWNVHSQEERQLDLTYKQYYVKLY